MSSDTMDTEELFEQPLIIRLPIFDRDKSIWGYEFISNELFPPSIASEGSPLSNLISVYKNAMSSLGVELSAEKKLFLNITNQEYLDNADLSEGWENCVFGMCQEVAYSCQCAGFVDSMVEKGACLSVDSDVAPEFFEQLVEKCDIVKVSLAGKLPAEIVKIRHEFKAVGCELMATDIVNWEAFEGTRALGFRYFQGPFFTVPQVEKDRELSAGAIAKLQLLKELGNPDCDMEELSGIIASDVSLSYRILKYINSASFGLKNQIRSIQQAVSLIGLKELKHWATVVVMSDLDTTHKGEELAYMALQRGRFLSNLAQSNKEIEHSSNTMFMLGLFSKLDAMMSYPMDKCLEDIPLDDDLKDGLCGVLNEFRDWLMMLDAVEIGNWGIGSEILGRYGVNFTVAATQYMKAASWAAHQLPNMKG